MKNNTFPNYAYASKKALQTLTTFKVDTFPLKIVDLIMNIKDIQLKTYKEIAVELNITVFEVKNTMVQSDLGCLTRMPGKGYLLIYNDDTSEATPERIRFTLAHELGHYMLNHLEKGEGTSITRNGYLDDEDLISEKEANRFARELLAPSTIFKYIDPLCKKTLMNLFAISNQTSTYALDYALKHDRYLKINELKDESQIKLKVTGLNFKPKKWFTKEFYGKINTSENNFSVLPHTFICTNCNHFNSGQKINFCPICGFHEIKNVTNENFFEYYEIKEESIMLYKKTVLNPEGIADICPICENEDLDPFKEICNVCGTYIKNKCSGLFPVDVQNEYEMPRPKDLQGCDNTLEGNSRYCTDCGAWSTYFLYDVLKPWREEYNGENQNTTRPLQLASSAIDIADDDLPF